MNKSKLKSIMCSTVLGMVALTSTAEMEATAKTPKDEALLKDITFVVFDTETTGWDKNSGRIIEIGAIKFKNSEVIAKKSWLINPGISITASSQRIHGIDDSAVKDSPSFKEVFPKFAAFTRGAVLLAHNASFDVRFMNAEIERNNLEAPANPTLDTLRLTRKWYPELKSHSLSSLVNELKISAGTLHRALADSACTKDIFLMGLKKMPENATYADLKKLAGKVRRFE